MRLQTLVVWVLSYFLPSLLWAKAYNEMVVVNLQGTIMVQHADASSPPTALMTNSIGGKGGHPHLLRQKLGDPQNPQRGEDRPGWPLSGRPW